MTLLPILAVQPDESLTSYLRRIGKFHTGFGDVYSFLTALDLPRAAVIDPSPETLDRIGDLTGQTLDTLHKMVIRSVQPRVRALGREHFHTEFANLKRTSFCPACLLADTQSGSPSGGLRVGRVSWRLATVRTCPHHGIELVRTPIVGKAHRFQHMDEVAPDNAGLAHLVEGAERRAPSALQRYVQGRLAGENGPAWLDAQPIDLAARSCEMLGLLLTRPVTRKMPDVSSADLDTAGAVGFEYAAVGEEAIRSVLKDVHDRAKAAGAIGGPAQAFGFFHAWLQDVGKQKPKGPIQEIARDYILDSFAVEAGMNLFGKVVEQERKHSAYSLARKLGSHAGTVHRALVYAGLLQGDAKGPSKNDLCDAVQAEALFSRIHTALSNRELRKYLNCHRTQAEQLVNSGILPQVIAQGDRGKNAAQHVALEDAETFLGDMLGHARRVDRATDGMYDIPRAARASGWSVVDVVQVLLAGNLNRVECVEPDLRFMSVLVDPVEVSAALRRRISADLVDFDEASRLLGIKRYGMRKFLQLRNQNGHPYLAARSVRNGEGGQIDFLSRKEIDAFHESHVSLVEIAGRMKWHPKQAKTRLAAARVLPVNDAVGIGRTFYRRQDLLRFASP